MAASLAALAALAVLPAPAAGQAASFGKPVEIGGLNGLGPHPLVADDGSVRVLKGADGEPRVEVVTFGAGSSKFRRCTIRELPTGSPAASVAYSHSPSGALAVAWGVFDSKATPRGRLAAVSAAPGRCPTKPQVLAAADTFDGVFQPAAGTSGTTLMLWGERRSETSIAYRYAVGSAGARFGKARKFRPPGTEGQDMHPAAAIFLPRDRVLWSWRTNHPGQPQLSRLWAATSQPGAGPVGRGRQIAERVISSEEQPPTADEGIRQTSASGAQVSWALRRRTVYVWSRAPGKPFGAPRTFQVPDAANGVGFERAAGNAAGDTAFVVEAGDDLWAITRRRDGRFGPFQNLTPGTSPRVATGESLAIDGAGRAVVAWVGQEQDFHLTGPGEVFVAVSDTKGSFGPGREISDPSRANDEDSPHVSANARGQIAVAWVRSFYGPTGIESAPVFVARGRITR